MKILLEPTDFEIGEKKYLLSKFPAMDGREIVTQYLASGIPKIGDYKRNEEIAIKLMGYVAAVNENGHETRLVTRELINSHVKDWETLLKIEAAMMEYNCSFFQNGQASDFLITIARTIKQLISQTLMASSGQSSAQNTQPSTS
jgi:hypothetical protein